MAPRILIIRFSSIGDIVLTTPVIRALHQQLGAEVHFLTKQSYRSILAHNPYLHQLHTIEHHVKEVLPTLRRLGFSAIIDLHHNLRSFQVKAHLAGVPHYSFAKLNYEKWLLTRLHIQRLPKVHIVDRYLDAAAPLGVKNDGKGLDYFLNPEDPLVSQWQFSSPYLALVIGAAHATKRLPENKLFELCEKLAYPTVLLGGPAEAAIGEQIAQLGPNLYNGCGKLSLNQSATIVKQARLVITHDTGLMHIAAAFRRPILSIWGNTVPEFGMTPYYGWSEPSPTSERFEVANLACRPCSKIGYATCPKGHFRCMQNQPLDRILAAAEQLMT